MVQTVCISGVHICIETEHALSVEEGFAPFLEDPQEFLDYTVRFQPVDRLPEVPKEILHQEPCCRIHPDGKGGFLRSFYREPECRRVYALGSYDYSAGRAEVRYLSSASNYVSRMGNAFFHLGFETLMLHRRRLCFHASCVKTELGGILFAGPSGIGKSTQAKLWCQYRNAVQINGDRPILSCDDGQWLAWGSPYAGSSRCYVNENCPIHSIVMLRQAPSCSLRKLSEGEAFRALYAGTTANSWDAEYMGIACDLIVDLIRHVPVYEFSCTKDSQAVEYLEKHL